MPAGPTSTKSWASSSAVAGSHSIGGAMTRSPLRMPMMRRSVSPVMKAPITGPSDRVYGNVMVLSSNLVMRHPFVARGRRAFGRRLRGAASTGQLGQFWGPQQLCPTATGDGAASRI